MMPAFLPRIRTQKLTICSCLKLQLEKENSSVFYFIKRNRLLPLSDHDSLCSRVDLLRQLERFFKKQFYYVINDFLQDFKL